MMVPAQGPLFGISQSELSGFSPRVVFLIFSIQLQERIVNFGEKRLRRIYNIAIRSLVGTAIKH